MHQQTLALLRELESTLQRHSLWQTTPIDPSALNSRVPFCHDTMAFEQWLVDVCGNAELSEQQRQAKLLEWQVAPAARFSHPREEHLLPLHVCYGTAMRPCSDIYELSIANKQASMFLWNA